MIGGQKRHRYRGGLGERPARRDRHHQAVIGDGGGRERVVREQSHHRITGRERRHVGGGVDDHAGGFTTEPVISDRA